MIEGLAIGLGLTLVAFACGSIPTGLLFARARGIDIQSVGSGNIGATNVARALGKQLGAVVLLLDAAKGALPCVAAIALYRAELIDPFFIASTGFFAICGHCFTPWLGFRGGKGVATSLGVFLAVEPAAAGISVAIFFSLYAAFRLASVGSLGAAIAFGPLLIAFHRPDHSVTLAFAGTVVILIQHRSNLRRLVRGEEYRV
jgi:glycerol-3-phosphate acyltransferase PlsY